MTLPGAPADAAVILIVEADRVTRELYERELKRVYRVVACANEDEARCALEVEEVQAVIVEPTLLSDAEWSFISALHGDPANAGIKVVICSTLDARRRGMEMGVDAYLVKPVLPSELLAVLNHSIGPVSDSLVESNRQEEK